MHIWTISGKTTKIQTDTKIRVYKAAILTILLCGSEVRNTTKKQHHRFPSAAVSEGYPKKSGIIGLGRWMFWRVPGSTLSRPLWVHWFGHVSRTQKHRTPQYLLEWKPAHGKRSRLRGSPRRNWEKCVLEDPNEAKELAKKSYSLWLCWEMIGHKREFFGAGHSNDWGNLIKYKWVHSWGASLMKKKHLTLKLLVQNCSGENGRKFERNLGCWKSGNKLEDAWYTDQVTRANKLNIRSKESSRQDLDAYKTGLEFR